MFELYAEIFYSFAVLALMTYIVLLQMFTKKVCIKLEKSINENLLASKEIRDLKLLLKWTRLDND